MEKIQLIIIFCLLFLVGSTTTNAQINTVSNVDDFNVRSSGIIRGVNQEVKGYYTLYLVEAAYSEETEYLWGKNNETISFYEVSFLDEHLNEVNIEKFEGSEFLVLRSVVFDGEYIMMEFYDLVAHDHKSNASDTHRLLKRFNATGELIDTKETKTFHTAKSSVVVVQNKGFLTVCREKGSTSVTIEFLPNSKEEEGWTLAEGRDVRVIGISESVALLAIKRHKKSYLTGVDINTGELLFEQLISSDQYEISVDSYLNTSFYDTATKQFFLFGEYRTKKRPREKSEGFYIYQYDETGKRVSEKYTSWKEEVGQFLPINANGRVSRSGHLLLHDIRKTSNGKTYIIAEQYKRVLRSPLRILPVLSILPLVVVAPFKTMGLLRTIAIKDIVLFELDEEYNLNQVQIFEKSKSHIKPFADQFLLGFCRPGKTVQKLRKGKHFDYQFCLKGHDDDFSFLFKNWNKKTKKFTLQTINYADGVISEDKIQLEKNADAVIYPAKKGHIFIAEYLNAKEKREQRLEKINF